MLQPNLLANHRYKKADSADGNKQLQFSSAFIAPLFQSTHAYNINTEKL